jgi:hypothetical protein
MVARWPREIEVPYFKRRLYFETNAPQPTERYSEEIGFLQVARDVLSLEAGEAAGPFRLCGPLQPGSRGVMVLDLALDKGGPPLAVSLTAGDLVGPASRIPADLVRISPSTITLFPDASAEVEVTVSAPRDARPGVHAGTISGTGDEAFIVVLEAEVR